MKNLRDYLLNESILDPVRKELPTEVWQGEKLKPSVKAYIIKTIELWLKANSKAKIKGIWFVGSMATYQYNSTADIDINVLTDLTEDQIKKIWALMPNGNNLPGTDHPINYYLIAKKDDVKTKDAIYDVLNDTWVKKPKREGEADVVTNFKAVIEVARFFIAGLDAAITEYETDVRSYKTYKEYYEDTKDEKQKEEIKKLMEHKLYEIITDIDGVKIAKYMVWALRKTAFEREDGMLDIDTQIEIKNANTSINNLIYKYVEKLGYFDKVHDIVEEAEKWKKEL